MGRFSGKTVLITGAASGIGRASAQAFAAEGASLYLCDINGEGLQHFGFGRLCLFPEWIDRPGKGSVVIAVSDF